MSTEEKLQTAIEYLKAIAKRGKEQYFDECDDDYSSGRASGYMDGVESCARDAEDGLKALGVPVPS